jgi:ribose transport system ATP-binding protein
MDVDRRAVAAPDSSQESREDTPREDAPPDGAVAGTDLLIVRGVSKQFGGTQALNDVGMRLNAGEILALLGENGAGKSTLIKILAGVHALDAGTVVFRGVDVTTTLRKLPIAFIHQDLGLIDWMTVAENICLTLGFPKRHGLVDWEAARGRAASALERVGAEIDPDLRIQDLSRTEKSLVAIARALAADAEILVLDEPTASLPADEVARLFEALRRLRARGVGMVYVSHRLDEVFEIADRMVVLRDGRVAGERIVAETTPDQAIMLIVGREPSQVFRRPAERRGSPRLVLDRLMVDAVGPVDCEIHAGEIVGFVGLRGAGQESVGRALFGVLPITSGSIHLDGKGMAPTSPREAMSVGVNLVCADRAGESIMSNLTVRENLFLNPVAAGRPAAERPQPSDRALVGRQSAEGGGRALVAPCREALRLRGSDRGRRCRRQGGNLSPFRRGAQGRCRSRDRVDRFRGGRESLPPCPGVRSRKSRGRARIGGSLRREPARRRFRQDRAFGEGDGHPFHSPGIGSSCSPLNRTRSSPPDRSSRR